MSPLWILGGNSPLGQASLECDVPTLDPWGCATSLLGAMLGASACVLERSMPAPPISTHAVCWRWWQP